MIFTQCSVKLKWITQETHLMVLLYPLITKTPNSKNYKPYGVIYHPSHEMTGHDDVLEKDVKFKSGEITISAYPTNTAFAQYIVWSLIGKLHLLKKKRLGQIRMSYTMWQVYLLVQLL